MRYSKEQLEKRYQSLPDIVKKFFGSEETIDDIIDIGKKYHLHTDQLNILSEEVSLVIYGLELPSNFHSNLKRYLGVSEDTANLITYDLNQQLFSKIREELSKMSEQDDDKQAPTNSSQQLYQQKMGGITSAPKQTVEVKAQTGDNKDDSATTKPPRDPYRESIN